ncbi:MAG: 4-(cytidine 5'-diphospho)-2-C-methyl-D-erythritol kinase [Alphaproteobacteria bacterium]|nr:4-(cytidine 5'-diphospho)-2-C-methyl-D-erythritol kinase [Alphaproteobacteria bacterium]
MIEEAAPAKINLFLHVGPVRADGLHEIASLFVFADRGDRIFVRPADSLSLDISGPFAPALEGLAREDNLVWRAAEALRALAGLDRGAAITLEKNLPPASGLGGGSADAAAALRALTRLWGLAPPEDRMRALAFGLGADVPACLAGRPLYVRGAGEILEAGPRLPDAWVALVNPGAPTPTGPIFRAFDAANPSPAPAAAPAAGELGDARRLAAFLEGARNDLEPYAIQREKEVGAAREYLAQSPGCLIARMSGSGASVFGLFAAPDAAEMAARNASAKGWWATAAKLAKG